MKSKIRILLADESETFVEQLRAVLEQNPAFIVVGAANDARRAIELLYSTQPDVLILDLRLSDRGEVSVLTAANACPCPPMVLALAGELTEQAAQKLESLGVRFMNRKPCKLQAVTACVQEMTAAKRDGKHPFYQAADAGALIDGALRELGVPIFLKGYQYLREAVLLAAGEMADAGIEAVYARVAKTCLTTPSRASRAIDHAIALAWGGDAELFSKCADGDCMDSGRMPTSAECIAHLAGQLQSQLKLALPC